MMSVKARIGIRVERTRYREPAFGQSFHSSPVGPASLAPAAECPAPEANQPISEYVQSAHVSRNCMVVEVTLYDRAEPFPCLHYRIMHALAKLMFYFFQLGGHALGDRLSLEGKLPILGLPAYMRDPQEPERLGF